MLFNEKRITKVRMIFDIEKWLRKSEFCNFVGLITLTKNVQQKFSHCYDSGVLASVWKVFIKLHWHGVLLM